MRIATEIAIGFFPDCLLYIESCQPLLLLFHFLDENGILFPKETYRMAKKTIKEYNANVKERQKLFSQAGLRAVNATRAALLPLTYVEGTMIIREVDGVKTVIGTVKPSVAVLHKKIKLSQ